MSARVFIVDDHPLTSLGLKQVIERNDAFSVVGTATDGETALAEIKRLKPDIAILDLHLPKMGGMEVARSLKGSQPPISIIFLTMQADEATFNAAMDVGAHGYILKDNAVQDVVLGLNVVASGGTYLSPTISALLLRRNQRASALREKKTGLKSLTQTERCVLRLVAENKTNKEIAAELLISHRTVEAHRSHICDKLELEGPRALVLFAVAHKSDL
jgi:DNA-binding NarL/FixJ family response regulator